MFLMPLSIYPTETSADVGEAREPNLDPEFVTEVPSGIGLEFIVARAGNPGAGFGPEDVFHCINAVLHSPEYPGRYAGLPKSDLPRVALTGNRGLFAALADLRRHLAALHG